MIYNEFSTARVNTLNIGSAASMPPWGLTPRAILVLGTRALDQLSRL